MALATGPNLEEPCHQEAPCVTQPVAEGHLRREECRTPPAPPGDPAPLCLQPGANPLHGLLPGATKSPLAERQPPERSPLLGGMPLRPLTLQPSSWAAAAESAPVQACKA